MERGIVVCNVPDYCVEEVSDHALALLALTRGVVGIDCDVRAGVWEPAVGATRAWRLQGRSLGLVGFGRIARRFAEKASPLGLTIRAFDPYVRDEELVRRDIEPVSLDALFKTSDIVLLHAPLTDETRHLVDAARLRTVWTAPVPC